MFLVGLAADSTLVTVIPGRPPEELLVSPIFI